MSRFRGIDSRKLSAKEHASAIDELKNNGFCVIRNYLTSDDCSLLLRQVESVLEVRRRKNAKSRPPVGIQKTIAGDRGLNNAICYIKDLLNVSTTGDHLKILTPFLNDPYYGLISPDEPNFILAQANLRYGDSALPFHVDVRQLAHEGKTWSYQAQLSITPRKSTSGGLRVRAGSHTLGEYPSSDEHYCDAEDVNLDAGDMVIFSSQLHHATYAASDETAGLAFNLTYRCWWVKPQFDFWRMVERDVIRALTKSQQVLLGGASQVPCDPDASPSLRKGYLTEEDLA